MRRFAVPGLITLVAAALLAVLAFGLSHSGPSTTLDGEVASGHFPLEPSAHLALPLLGTKKTETLADLRGHYVMIDFSAGWCDACQQDAGVVANAQRLLEKDGGTVLGVTFQDSTTDAENYMRQYHLDYPVLQDANGQLATAYGVDGVPETFVVNPEGKVVLLRRYQLTQKWVDTSLTRALSGAA